MCIIYIYIYIYIYTLKLILLTDMKFFATFQCVQFLQLLNQVHWHGMRRCRKTCLRYFFLNKPRTYGFISQVINFAYIYIYIYIYICVCVCVCVCVCAYARMRVDEFRDIGAQSYTDITVWNWKIVYLCLSTQIYICVLYFHFESTFIHS